MNKNRARQECSFYLLIFRANVLEKGTEENILDVGYRATVIARNFIGPSVSSFPRCNSIRVQRNHVPPMYFWGGTLYQGRPHSTQHSTHIQHNTHTPYNTHTQHTAPHTQQTVAAAATHVEDKGSSSWGSGRASCANTPSCHIEKQLWYSRRR